MNLNDRIDAFFRYSLLLALLIAPTQAGIRIHGAYVSPVDPLIWGLFAAWLAWRIAGCRSLRFTPPPATFIFFVAAVAISAVRATHKSDALKDIIQAAEYFLAAAILFLNVFREPRAARRALGIHLACVVAVIALACAQYLHPGIDNFDVSGSFGNRNVFGGYLALTLPLLFGVTLYGGINRRMQAAAVAVIAAGLLVNLSGATMVALMIALPFVALCHSRRAAAVTIAAMLFMFVFVIPRMPRGNFEEMRQSVRLFEPDGELSARYTEWLGALAMWNEQPLLIGGPHWLEVDDQWGAGIQATGWLVGVGAGNFQNNIGMYYGYLPQVNINITEPDSHNTYLVMLSTLGLLGVIGFLGMLMQSAGAAMRNAADTDADRLTRGVRIGVAGAVAAYAFNAVWAGLLVRGIGIPLAFTLTLPWIFETKTQPGSRPNIQEPTQT